MASAPPPVKLREYDLTERLGQGSYGSVFKGRGKVGARPVVAVKCVLKSELSKGEADNLITEIGLLKTLKHAHIVEMTDFCWDASYIYIIMEYCGAGDLSKYIKRSPDGLPEHICRRFLQQLAAALRFLHSKKIAHMDLKPSNILLTGVGRRPCLKLADFGLSQRLSDHGGRTSGVRGSYLYMAPEVVLKRSYDAKVDLWSVGVILYECLFGRAPYKSATVEELLAKVKEDKPIVIPRRSASENPTNISPNCRDLLKRCLVRDPKERISFDEFFCHPFLDLEHMPGEESSAKATAILEKAVAEDQAGNLEAAIDLYKKGLEYLVPAMQHESSTSKRDLLKKRAEQYLARAEQLKCQLNPSLAARQEEMKLQKRSSVERTRLDDLVSLSQSNPKLLSGIEIAAAAEAYELEGSLGTALEKYEQALSILLPTLSEEPSGQKRQALLHGEVTRWLKRAETVKELLDLRDRELQESLENSIKDKNCSLQ